MLLDDHHEDGIFGIWCAAPPGNQELLIAANPARFFRPPYVGHRGWLGVRLNEGVDWDELVGSSRTRSRRLRRSGCSSRAPTTDDRARLCAESVPIRKGHFRLRARRRYEGGALVPFTDRSARMHRINSPPCSSSPPFVLAAPVRTRRDVVRRRQPGLRRRRQRRRDVSRTTSSSSSTAAFRGRPHRLDGAVRVGDSTSWSATPLAGSIQPAATTSSSSRRRPRSARRCRRPTRRARRTSPRPAARSRSSTTDRAHVRRNGGQLLRAPRSSRTSSATERRPTTRAPRRRPRSRAQRPPCARAEAAPTPTRTPPTSRRRRPRRATARPPRRRARERRRAEHHGRRGRRRGAGAVPLRRARALEHQLRPGVRRADAAPRSPSA